MTTLDMNAPIVRVRSLNNRPVSGRYRGALTAKDRDHYVDKDARAQDWIWVETPLGTSFFLAEGWV